MITEYKKQGKRIIAAFLAICMILVMPLNVSAAELSDGIYEAEVNEGTPTDADKAVKEDADVNTDEAVMEDADVNANEAVSIAADASGMYAASEEGLESLIISTAYSPSSANVILRNETDTSYATSNVFSTGIRNYNLGSVNDNYTTLYFRAKPCEGYDTVTLKYGDGDEKDIKMTNSSPKNAQCILPGKNTFTIEVSGSGKSTVVYTFNLNLIPTLTGLTFDTGEYEQFTDKVFVFGTFEYTLTIPDGAGSVTFNAVPRKDNYTVTYNDSPSPAVAMQGVDKVLVKVSVGEGSDKLENIYTVNIDKKKSSIFKVNTVPEDAVVMVYDKNGLSLKKKNGGYEGLFSTGDYLYTVTKTGYIGVSGSVPAAGGEINVTLNKAPENQPQEVDAQWKNFRDSDVNMFYRC